MGHEVRPNLLVLSLISLRLHGLFGLVILVLHLHCKSGKQIQFFIISSVNLTGPSATKASLMGPFSGIGDTLFWGILRVVAAGIAMTFGTQGNILAPIVFLIVYNVPSFWCRWELTKLGYSLGSHYIEDMYESGMMDILTKAASVLGLIMLGGMTGNLVTFKSKMIFHLGGGQTLQLQSILDQIFKGIIPLSLTLGCFYLLSKRM
ncbi:hypothetical protein ATO00_11470 [Loigolactobacillus coryniformis subsp. coryniformis]|nr:hypothetical protein ATO00_11470 [Loigolactobacillus coryniformis subsp. coryniformis]